MWWRRIAPAVRIQLVFASAGLAFYALDEWLNRFRSALVPKNFAVVRTGVLYRSGQLRPRHLEQVLQRERIQTIVCLNPGDAPYEVEIANRLGVRHVTIAMPGSGRGTAADFNQFLNIVADPAQHPVLVHCNAGAYRTGAAVALYRHFLEHWPFAAALDEMSYCGCPIQRDREFQSYLDRVRAELLATGIRGPANMARACFISPLTLPSPARGEGSETGSSHVATLEQHRP